MARQLLNSWAGRQLLDQIADLVRVDDDTEGVIVRQTINELLTQQQQISSLKNNCSFFSRLNIGSQVRDGHLGEFFQHENQHCPPSLSQMGVLRGGTKLDLLSCL